MSQRITVATVKISWYGDYAISRARASERLNSPSNRLESARSLLSELCSRERLPTPPCRGVARSIISTSLSCWPCADHDFSNKLAGTSSELTVAQCPGSSKIRKPSNSVRKQRSRIATMAPAFFASLQLGCGFVQGYALFVRWNNQEKRSRGAFLCDPRHCPAGVFSPSRQSCAITARERQITQKAISVSTRHFRGNKYGPCFRLQCMCCCSRSSRFLFHLPRPAAW